MTAKHQAQAYTRSSWVLGRSFPSALPLGGQLSKAGLHKGDKLLLRCAVEAVS